MVLPDSASVISDVLIALPSPTSLTYHWLFLPQPTAPSYRNDPGVEFAVHLLEAQQIRLAEVAEN